MKQLLHCLTTCRAMIALAVISHLSLGVATGQDPKGGVQWLRSAHEAVEVSKATDKPILVYVRSKSCHFCDKMQDEVWDDPDTAKLIMHEFVPLKLTNEENRPAVQAMKVTGFPSTLLFSPGLKYLGRRDGYLPREQFLNAISTMLVAGAFEGEVKR